MNVRPHEPQALAPPRTTATRVFDATVNDDGVQVRRPSAPPVAAAPAAPQPVAAPEPTSSAAIGATLTSPEKQAIEARFADLPRDGVTGTGVYTPRGRASQPPPEAYQGRLLDVTG